MSIVSLIIVLITALVVTSLLTPRIRNVALRMNWIDETGNPRKIHSGQIPNIGGLAIIVGFSIAFLVAVSLGLGGVGRELWQFTALWLGAVSMCLVGLYDDLSGLGFKKKFAFQSGIAWFMVQSGYSVDVTTVLTFIPDGAFAEGLSAAVSVLWFVGLMNAVNMIDGMDGLASGVAVIAFTTLSFAFAMAGDLLPVGMLFAIIGALLGFLFFNTHPATIFMGDSGSLVLGFLLAAGTLQWTHNATEASDVIFPVLVAGLPVLDTFTAIVRRMRAGRSPFSPDRDHMHHRVYQLFGNYKVAIYLMYMIGSTFGVFALMINYTRGSADWAVLAITAGFSFFVLMFLGYLPFGTSMVLDRRRHRHAQIRSDRAATLENAVSSLRAKGTVSNA